MYKKNRNYAFDHVCKADQEQENIFAPAKILTAAAKILIIPANLVKFGN